MQIAAQIIWFRKDAPYCFIMSSYSDNFIIMYFITNIYIYTHTHTHTHSQDQQEGTQMQNERNKYLLKHKTLQGGAQGEQSWNYSKQQERTKHPEVDSLESSPSWYQWKIICTRLGWQTAWGNQQAGSLRLVEQDWREHTAQTRQHAKHVIKGKNNKVKQKLKGKIWIYN